MDRESVTTEIERKYLLAAPPDLDALRAAVGDVQTIEIEQRYLASPPGVERRVRRMTVGDAEDCVRTEKRAVEGTRLERLETEEAISAADFVVAAAETLGAPIIKRRHVFVHAGRRFELDQFLSPIEAWLLEVELAGADEVVSLPAFLDIDREVTDEPQWRNSSIAAAYPSAEG